MMSLELRWSDTEKGGGEGEAELLGKKLVPVPFCSPKISY